MHSHGNGGEGLLAYPYGELMASHGWILVAPNHTGNTAFDEYRDETLRRLEDEQSAFEHFLGSLRRAKDRAEFDQFMTERRNGPVDAQPAG